MAFWKFKAWFHHQVSKFVFVGIIVGAVLLCVFFWGRISWIWDRIHGAMTF